MELIKGFKDENELLEELKVLYSDDIALDMLRAVKRNGMSAYGKYMIRKSGREYLLLGLPEIKEVG